jgi:DNA polymerase-3 subunit gamma/tau
VAQARTAALQEAVSERAQAAPPAVVMAEQRQAEAQAQAGAAQQPGISSPTVAGLTLAELSPDNWPSSFEQLGFGGVVGNIASHCVLQQVDGDTLHFVIDEANATLFNDSYHQRIQDQLCTGLGQAVTIQITIGPVSTETPAALKARTLAESRQHALDSLQNDPNIQCLIEEFGATLNPDSVVPIH